MSLPRATLAKYISPGCRFVETGTRWGDTCIRAAELGAAVVFSCESDGIMAAIAQEHIADQRLEDTECVVIHCDSVDFLSKRICAADVIFLDAHTASNSPVIKELNAIACWVNKPRVILIDDMRLMGGWGIYQGDLRLHLEHMGYDVSYDRGIEENDVMVGTLRA